jgi:hypothetical protein
MRRHLGLKTPPLEGDDDPGQVVATVTNWRDGSPHAHIEVWRTLQGDYENMLDPMRFFP